MPDNAPLSGVKVLDLTNVLAGPFASYQLSLQGADVVKVEVPGSGDLARQLGASPELNSRLLGTSFVAQNSGKRSIALNLKSEDGKKVFASLVRDADVLIENFRPGVLSRLGFSYEELERLNPGLIYCAISGFGQSGPLKDRAAYDQIVQGMSGMMSVTGTQDTGSLRAGFPVADTLGGMAAAYAISAALFSRTSSGAGCQIDISMLEAAITAMGWVVSNYLLADSISQPIGNENFTAAPSGTFTTGDGELNISANKQDQFERLCAILARPDLLDDPRFNSREARKTNRLELKNEIEAVLKTRRAAEWEPELAAKGIPVGRVLNIEDAINQEQIRVRELIHEVPNPTGEAPAFRVVGNAVRVNGAPGSPQGGPPQLGEHTDEILRAAGYDDREIMKLRVEGAIG